LWKRRGGGTKPPGGGGGPFSPGGGGGGGGQSTYGRGYCLRALCGHVFREYRQILGSKGTGEDPKGHDVTRVAC